MLNPNVADGGNNSVDALKEHARELHDAARLRLTEIASMPTDQRVVLRQQRRERNAQLVCDGLFADVPLDGTAVAAAVSPIDDPRYADAVEEYLDLLTNIDVTAEALDAAAAKLFGMAAALAKVPASQRADAAQVVRTNQLAQNRAAVKRALLQRCGECGILGPAYFEPSDDEAYAEGARKILKLAAVDPTGNAQNIKQLIDDLNARLAGFEKWAPEQRRRAADDRRRRYARLVSEGVDPFTRERLSVVSKPNADRSFILSDDAKYRDLLDHLESLITGNPLEASKPIADALAAMQARQAAIKAEATPEQLKLAAKQGAALDAKKLLDRLATTAEHVNRDTLVLGPKYFVPTDSPDYKQMVDELRRLVLLDPNANAGAINELISPLADLATDLTHNCSKTEKQAMVDVRRRANLVALASGREPGNDADLVALHADAEGVVMAPVSDPEFNGALTALMGELQDNSGVINTDAVFDLVAALQQRHADLQMLDAKERKAQMAIGHTARKETVQSLVYRCLIPAGLDSLLGPMYFVPTDDDDFKKLHDESKQLAETNPGDENDGRIQQLAQAMAARAVTLAQLPEVTKRTMAAARRRRNADMLRRGIDPTTGKPFALLMARRAFRLTDDPKYEALHTQYHAKVGDPLPADKKAVDGLHGDMKTRAAELLVMPETDKRRMAQLGAMRTATKKLDAAATDAGAPPEGFKLTDDADYNKLAADVLQLLAVDPTGNQAAIQQLEEKLEARKVSLMELPEECKHKKAESRRRRMAANIARGLDPVSGKPLNATDGGFRATDDDEYQRQLQLSFAALTANPAAADVTALTSRGAVLAELSEDQKSARAALRQRTQAATRTRPFMLTDDEEYSGHVAELNRLIQEDPKKHAQRITELQGLLKRRATTLQALPPAKKERIADEQAEREARTRRDMAKKKGVFVGDAGMGSGEYEALQRERFKYGGLDHDDQYMDWASEAEKKAKELANRKKKAEDDDASKAREEKEKLKADRERAQQEELERRRKQVEAAKAAQRKKAEQNDKAKLGKAALMAKQKEDQLAELDMKRAREQAEMLKRKALVRAKLGVGDGTGHGLTEEELETLRGHFAKVDKDGSGEIDKDEFAQFYNNVMGGNMTKKELYDIFDKLDADGGGSLSFDEFVKVYKIMLEMEMAKKDPLGAQKLKDLEGQLKRKQANKAAATLQRAGLKARAFGRVPDGEDDEDSDDDVLDNLDRSFHMSDDDEYKTVLMDLEECLGAGDPAQLAKVGELQSKLTARAAVLDSLPEDEKRRLALRGAKRDATLALDAARRIVAPLVAKDYIELYLENRDIFLKDPLAGEGRSAVLLGEMKIAAPRIIDALGGGEGNVLPDDPCETGYLQDIDERNPKRDFMLTDDDEYLGHFMRFHELLRKNPEAHSAELGDLARKMRERAKGLAALPAKEKADKLAAARKRNAAMSRRRDPTTDPQYQEWQSELARLRKERFPPADRIRELESYCGEALQRARAPYKGGMRNGGIKDDYVGGLGGPSDDKAKRESFPRRPFKYTDDEAYRALFDEYRELAKRDPVANAPRLKELERLMRERAALIDKMKQDERDRMRDLAVERDEALARKRLEHDRAKAARKGLPRQQSKVVKKVDNSEALKKQNEDELAKKRAAVEAAKVAAQAKKDKLEAEKAVKAAQMAKQKEEELAIQEAKKQREEGEMMKRKALVRAKRGGGDDDDDNGLTEEELETLRGHFAKVDKDGSGQIDKDEFAQFYNNVMGGNLSKKELYDIFDQLDVDGGGSLSFEEFAKVYKIMLEMEMAKKDPSAVAKMKSITDLLKQKKDIAARKRDEARRMKGELQAEKSAADMEKKAALEFKRAAKNAARLAKGLEIADGEDAEDGSPTVGRSFVAQRKSMRKVSARRSTARSEADSHSGSEADLSRRGSHAGSRVMSRAGSGIGGSQGTGSVHSQAFGSAHDSESDHEPAPDEIEARDFKLTDDPEYRQLAKELAAAVDNGASADELSQVQKALEARAAAVDKLDNAEKADLALEGATKDAKDAIIAANAVVAAESEAPFNVTADSDCADMLRELVQAVQTDPAANATYIDELVDKLTRRGATLQKLSEEERQGLILKACARSTAALASGVDPSSGAAVGAADALPPFSMAHVNAFQDTAASLRECLAKAPLDVAQLQARVAAAAQLARELAPQTEEERVLHTVEAAREHQSRLELELLQSLKTVIAGDAAVPTDDDEYRQAQEEMLALVNADPVAQEAAIQKLQATLVKRALQVAALSSAERSKLVLARRKLIAERVSKGLNPEDGKAAAADRWPGGAGGRRRVRCRAHGVDPGCCRQR
jgi:Ca2+-binding EF-hand superfamily protein